MSAYSEDSTDYPGVAGCADRGVVAKQPLFGGYARRFGAGFWRLCAVGDSVEVVRLLLSMRVPVHEHEHTVRVAGDPPQPLAPPG